MGPKDSEFFTQDSKFFSSQSYQEDGYFLAFSSDLNEFSYYSNDDSFFPNSTEYPISSNKTSSSDGQVSEDDGLGLIQNSSQIIIPEASTNESSHESSDNFIHSQIFKHHRNSRIKKCEKSLLQKVFKLGFKYAHKKIASGYSNKKNDNLTQKLTKNLLAFAKKPILDWIKKEKRGSRFLQENTWIEQIQYKVGINMDDYDKIYKNKELKQILMEFFAKKVIDRELMLSRTTKENKLFFGYYLQVFERNFRKGSFNSISETMREIEKQKKYL